MTRDELVRAQSVSLPELVTRRKESGDLKGAQRAIDALLADDALPRMVRARLMVEKERLRRLPTQYPDSREEAFRKLREKVPGLTEAEFDACEDKGWFDWIMVEGEKRYFVRNTSLAIKRPELSRRLAHPGTAENSWLDPMIRETKENGFCARRIQLDGTMKMEEGAFTPGLYRAWLPFPAACAQQTDIQLTDGKPDRIAPADAPARTAYWEKQLDRWEDIHLGFAYTSRILYADPMNRPAPAQPLYPAAGGVLPEDLEEDPPFIRFTPFLRGLAEELAGDETAPVRKAWKYYEFITTRVRYSYVRDYFQIDDLGEFCARDLKGDCGLQALLFIALCRLSGIPARWQSGLSIDDDGPGCHDWAQFYLDGWGWLFADPSFGGSAWRAGAKERHHFYFGNIDPTRMVANRVFEAETDPVGQALRLDPYDNQSGELERDGAPLPFTGRELDMEWRTVSIEKQ